MKTGGWLGLALLAALAAPLPAVVLAQPVAPAVVRPSVPPPLPAAVPPGPSPGAVQAPGSATVPAPSADYRLGAGDLVRITVFQNPDLTTESRVSESGVLTFPLLGVVRLGGLNVTQAERLIADGLRNGNFVRSPQVSLVVMMVRGNQVSVLGQFNRPGRYPLETADLRLSDLVAMAGGVAPNGGDTVVLSGQRNGKPLRVEVDLPSLFAEGGRQHDVPVQNGDAIWVDRQPILYIYGEVQRPGAMRLERGMTLMQALATGGGLTPRGTERGIRVHRRGPDGRQQVITPTMDAALADGDVIYVRESLF